MSPIVAARFKTFAEAERVRSTLLRHGYRREDISVFFVNPAGQHDKFPIGGDELVDPGARNTPHTAALGAAFGAGLGIIIGTLVVVVSDIPAIAAAITGGIGAYVGSLIGSMQGTRSAQRPARAGHSMGARHAGVLVAVKVQRDSEELAVRVLRDAGGLDIEHDSGELENGEWRDFDPVHAPVLTDKTPPRTA